MSRLGILCMRFFNHGAKKIKTFFLYGMISPDTAEVVHNIPLSSDSESEAVPPRAPPRKKKPALLKPPSCCCPLSSKGFRMRGTAAERSALGSQSLFFSKSGKLPCSNFSRTLTRILNKWAGWRREAEKVKIPKRHVPIWQAFEPLPHAEKRLGWKRSWYNNKISVITVDGLTKTLSAKFPLVCEKQLSFFVRSFALHVWGPMPCWKLASTGCLLASKNVGIQTAWHGAGKEPLSTLLRTWSRWWRWLHGMFVLYCFLKLDHAGPCLLVTLPNMHLISKFGIKTFQCSPLCNPADRHQDLS